MIVSVQDEARLHGEDLRPPCAECGRPVADPLDLVHVACERTARADALHALLSGPPPAHGRLPAQDAAPLARPARLPASDAPRLLALIGEPLAVYPVEIAERAGLPFRSRGKGAPVESRLVVRGGLLNLRPEDRRRLVVRIAVTVGELLDALWPPSPRRGRPRDAENWPKLLTALHRARDFHVPDATGGRWFPLAVRRLPSGSGHPWAERPTDGRRPARDELIVLDLAPVPGAETGASVDLPFVDRVGVTSGPRWFAYLAGRTLIWRPGVTRRPAPGGRYGWSSNPADYPVLTLADLRRFAFGATDKGARARAAIVAPWSALPDLVLLPDETDARTGIRGYRLLPTEAEAALLDAREGGATGENGRNRKASGRNRK